MTQSTLSSMIQKLETELDMQIFDRNSHPVCPTAQGENVIRQAQVILYNVAQMKEMVLSERMQESGELHLGVIPTIAPYIIPKLIRHMHSHYPHVQLRLLEARTAVLVEKLERAEIDVALLSTPARQPETARNSHLLRKIQAVYFARRKALHPTGDRRSGFGE